MKKRLSALDGLRGLAAISVMLSHLHNNLVLLAFGPIIYSIYGVAFAGSNAVQILFVLTGFLMAFLYPTLKSPVSFIKKRYTRIFPMLILANIFFWVLFFEHRANSWIIQIILILVLAFGIRFIWQYIKVSDKNEQIGKILFWGFVILQLTVFFYLVFIFPSIAPQHPEGTQFHNVLTLLANITVTRPISGFILNVNDVFWSLPVEVLFYIVYPFFVIPLIYVGKKWGWVVGLLLIMLTTKIVFDLDNAFIMFKSPLIVLNIAHSSGFIAGVTIGTIYQQQGKLWNRLEKLAQNNIIGIITLVLLIFTQWANVSLPYAGDKIANNYYFLFASWVIALTIIGAITPKSIIQKIFDRKLFVFLGVISYTLYLTHEQAINWTSSILSLIHLPLGIYLCLTIIIATVLSILLAWFLYHIVDKLYFTYHKRLPKETMLSSKQKIDTTPRPPSFTFLAFTMTVYLLLIICIYTLHYPASLLVDTYSIQPNHIPPSSIYALGKNPIEFPFTGKNNNINTIALHLQYDNNKIQSNNGRHAVIVFQLLDNAHHIIYTSLTSAVMVENVKDPEFTFNFPPLSQSAGKEYITEFSMRKDSSNDQVLLSSTSPNFITYAIKDDSPLGIIQLLLNRIFLLLTTPSTFIALLIIPVVLSEYIWGGLMLLLRNRKLL